MESSVGRSNLETASVSCLVSLVCVSLNLGCQLYPVCSKIKIVVTGK